MSSNDHHLEQPATAKQLYALAQQHQLTPIALDWALQDIGVIPDRHAWRSFIDRALLVLGILLTLAGVIFFFAYNWADLPYWAKFAVLQLAILGTVLSAGWRGLDQLSGRIALFAAAVLVGVLLSVYGQVYQTGADVFVLFLTWAILITPWVLLGCFAPLYLLLLLLLNASLILYWQQVVDPYLEDAALSLFVCALNGSALVAWEIAWKKQVQWLRGRWFSWIAFSSVLIALMWPTLLIIIEFNRDRTHWQSLGAGLYVFITLFSLWYYRYQRHDIFSLVICLLSLLVTLTTLIGRLLFEMVDDAALTFFALTLVVVGETSLATTWLRRVASTPTASF